MYKCTYGPDSDLYQRYLELPKSPNFTVIPLDITEIPIKSSEIPLRWKDKTLF